MIRGGDRYSVTKGLILSTTTPNTNTDREFTVKNLPQGYQTVLGFMSAEEFTELELITEPLDFIKEYSPILIEASKGLDKPFLTVDASPYASSKGLKTEIAFDNAILYTTLI